MLKWCMENKEILQQHNLSGTGTTARMIADYVGLKIKVVLCQDLVQVKMRNFSPF